MNDLDFPELRQTLNRGLDFGMREISRSGIELASGGDLALAMIKIREWQSKGWLKVLKDPIIAAPDEICLEILSMIDGNAPWSDPMSGKM